MVAAWALYPLWGAALGLAGATRNPGYNYVFVQGSWQATRHLSPFVRIGNALDERYQEALGYLALSRNATGGVRVMW